VVVVVVCSSLANTGIGTSKTVTKSILK